MGDELRLGVVHGHGYALAVSGIVRDSGLAAGSMENLIYGFITSPTLKSLGGSPNFDRLQIVVSRKKLDEGFIRRVAFEVRTLIESTGRAVYDVGVPKANQHVHAEQMDSLLLVQGALGALALVLSAMLILNLVTAILAGQVREIGVMKALGASPGQVMGIYLLLAVLLGVTASALAIPIAMWTGNTYAEYVAGLLNFDITGYHPRAVMSLIIIVVGGLGLATTMSLAVLERIREIGLMRAIGAPHKTIYNIIVVEGLFIGILSFLIAIPLSVPMSLVVGNAFGRIMFQAPIDFVATPSGVVIWMAIVLVVSALASLFPALKATQRTLAETLAFE